MLLLLFELRKGILHQSKTFAILKGIGHNKKGSKREKEKKLVLYRPLVSIGTNEIKTKTNQSEKEMDE